MSQHLLRGPEGTNPDEGGSSDATGSNSRHPAGSGQKRRSRNSEAASADQCLRALTQLPGLVALGMLTPAQGNCMRGVFATILQHYQRSQTTPIPARASADLAQAVRDKPQLAALLEPLLTDDQLESLLDEARDSEDNDDGEADLL